MLSHSHIEKNPTGRPSVLGRGTAHNRKAMKDREPGPREQTLSSRFCGLRSQQGHVGVGKKQILQKLQRTCWKDASF